MNPKLAQELKDTIKFLYLYNQSAAIRESVNQIINTTPNLNKVIIELPGLPKRPLMRYLGNLAGYSANFGQYSQSFFRTYRNSPTSITDNLHTFLNACYRDTRAVEEFRAIPDQYVKGGSTDEKQGQDRTFQPLTQRLQRSFNQTVERMGVTDQDRKFESYRIWEKLYKYGDELKTREGRDKLIKAKLLSKEEVSFLLTQGLIPFADKVSDKHNFNRFIKHDEPNGEAIVDEELWRKAVAAAAGRDIEEKIKAGVWKKYKQATQQDRQQLLYKIESLKKITGGNTFSSLQELRNYLTAINLLGNYKFNQWEINTLLASGLILEATFEKELALKLSLPKFTVPGKLKNIVTALGIGLSNLTKKYLTPQHILNAIPSIALGVVGFSTGGVVGGLAGLAGGQVLPRVIKDNWKGWTNSLNNSLQGVSDRFLGFANDPLATIKKKVGFMLVGIFITIATIAALLQVLSTSNINNYQLPTWSFILPSPTPGPPSSIQPPAGGSGNLTSCQFTRGDQNPTAQQYQSPLLLSYFQEASLKSGVPATILAGIARVESPGIVNYADDNLTAYGCPQSPTGALGLMQIQPPGTIGSPELGIAFGAGYLGIPYTQVNYCDLHQNIFIGAGVVASKRPGGSWDPLQTFDKDYIDGVASSYYGCLNYPSCSSGPYSYGDDLWNSLQSCSQSLTGQIANNISSTINSGLSTMAQIAQQITNSLSLPTQEDIQRFIGFNLISPSEIDSRLFSVNHNSPNEYYWCTYLIIDAYNLAGRPGLNRSEHGGVINMKSFFQNTPGYQLLSPITLSSQIQSGDVVFFEGPNGQHVSLVTSVDVDENGNGAIHTYDANNIVTEDIVPVVAGRATVAQTTANKYAITGFGRAI